MLVSTVLEEAEYVTDVTRSGTLYDSHEFTNEREGDTATNGFGTKL